MRQGRSKFADDINEIVSLVDVVPTFEPGTSKPDPSGIIGAVLELICEFEGLSIYRM